jgi:hypothetical protein
MAQQPAQGDFLGPGEFVLGHLPRGEFLIHIFI